MSNGFQSHGGRVLPASKPQSRTASPQEDAALHDGCPAGASCSGHGEPVNLAEPAPERVHQAVSPLRGLSPRKLIDHLFSRVGPDLARTDLHVIVTEGAGYVQAAASAAARVAMGLGCLVANSTDPETGQGAGSFQNGESVAHLLWNMQSQLEAVEAMAAAVGWAAEELDRRSVK